jgi:lipopolysaccharide heptosyltransferase II
MTLPSHAHWIRVPRFFGDAVMIHSALARLRAAGEPLVVWGPAWVVDLFAGAAGYVGVQPEPGRNYSSFAAARMLKAHRPASVICFPKSQRPMLAALLAGVPLRLGCGDGIGWLLLTHQVQFYRQDSHFVERYASVVERAFPQLPETRVFQPFRPRDEALDAAAARAKELGLGEFVIFAPGANSDSKRLPLPAFGELGRRLAREGIRPVVLGGPADHELARAILEACPGAVDLTGQSGLAESAAWICAARALVGVDSGLAHLAAAAGIPTLAVYGPTRPRHSAPLGPRVKVVRREGLECLECMRGSCPVSGHPCMQGLEHEVLWSALEGLLAGD